MTCSSVQIILIMFRFARCYKPLCSLLSTETIHADVVGYNLISQKFKYDDRDKSKLFEPILYCHRTSSLIIWACKPSEDRCRPERRAACCSNIKTLNGCEERATFVTARRSLSYVRTYAGFSAGKGSVVSEASRARSSILIVE
jgi:hypothetical protein